MFVLVIGVASCDPDSPSQTTDLNGLTASRGSDGRSIVVADSLCSSDLVMTQFSLWDTPELSSTRDGHLIATVKFSPPVSIPRSTVIDDHFFQEAVLSSESPIETFDDLMSTAGFSVTEDLVFDDGLATDQIIFVAPGNLATLGAGEVLFGDDGIPMAISNLCPTSPSPT